MKKLIISILFFTCSYSVATIDPCKTPKKKVVKKYHTANAVEPTQCAIPKNDCKYKHHEFYGLLGIAPFGLNQVNNGATATVEQDYNLTGGLGYSFTPGTTLTFGAEVFTNKSIFGRVGFRF